MTRWLETTPARPFGFAEWFRPGEHDRVLEAIEGMRRAGASAVRTHLSWAEYHTPGGQGWYDWLIPTLGRAFDLLPCLLYTPPSLSRTGRTSGAPRRLADFADFADHILSRHGEHFRAVELWNEPNNLADWDWREDHEWLLFCEMIGGAAHWIRRRGWDVVLGAPHPFDARWLELMGERGVLGEIAALGVHGFPGTWDGAGNNWPGFAAQISEARDIVHRFQPGAEIWLTEAGYSTWRQDEAAQVDCFRDALAAPAERVFWYGWQDIAHDVPTPEGLRFDPRHYHLGVTDSAGRPKLLRRLLERGCVETTDDVPAAPVIVGERREPVLILGGAGFIGSNLAQSFLREGRHVVLFDSLERAGVERNLHWLSRAYPDRLHPVVGDIRDRVLLAETMRGVESVFHLAAQVAVTTSLSDPRHDFAINLEGTLNVLECLRQTAPHAPLLFSSTNKVYGQLGRLGVEALVDGYAPTDEAVRQRGIDETWPLDFCTPYGCSKGAADQYVLDYAHSFGLHAAVLRMSCIYGPRQFGTEDQGWVAHFLIKALRGQPITLFGDGKQVRDILHVTDAVAAYRGMRERISEVEGHAFNLGGGVENAVSLHEVIAEIGTLLGHAPDLRYEGWRQGDQPYFVADTHRLAQAIGWRPQIGWRDGVRDLADWLREDLETPEPRQARALA